MNRNPLTARSQEQRARPPYRGRSGNGSWLTLLKILFFACGFTVFLGVWLKSRSHFALPIAFEAVPEATLARVDSIAGQPSRRSAPTTRDVGTLSSSPKAVAAAGAGVSPASAPATRAGASAPSPSTALRAGRSHAGGEAGPHLAVAEVPGFEAASVAPVGNTADGAAAWQMPPRPIRTAAPEASTPGSLPPEPAADAGLPPIPPVSAQPAREWGIEVASLRLTAGGNAVDLRYKVLDPAKSAAVLAEGGPAYILDENGQRIASRNVQQIGGYYAARHLDQPGRVYSTWFANQGGALKSGDLVSVVLGDLRVANIRVE